MVYDLITVSLIIIILIVLIVALTLHDLEGLWIDDQGNRYLLTPQGWSLNNYYRITQKGVDQGTVTVAFMGTDVYDGVTDKRIGAYDRFGGSILWMDKTRANWYKLREVLMGNTSWRILLNYLRPTSIQGRWWGVRQDGSTIKLLITDTTGYFMIGNMSMPDTVTLTWNAGTRQGSFTSAIGQAYTYQWDGYYVVSLSDGTNTTTLYQLVS